MSNPMAGGVSPAFSTKAVQPTASDPTTAGAVASTHAPVTSMTKISSLADLKRKAPKVYKMMMFSIQEMVRRDMQDHQQRLKKAIRGEG